MIGKVYLVGAGPGLPDLITVRGLEIIKEADVILYDRLVHPQILEYAEKAEKLYCGKNPDSHAWDQDKINLLLIKKAKAGNNVARLKGGDPFIFGRGGEEALALTRAGIPFEVIPGVSSAIGIPTFNGIPLTHRGKSSTLAIVTGRQDPTGPSIPVDWEKVALMETIVILMGVKSLAEIIPKIRKIKPAKTPVAIISWGTCSKQSKLVGNLGNIIYLSKKAKIIPPSIIIIGSVVEIADKLSTLENLTFNDFLQAKISS